MGKLAAIGAAMRKTLVLLFRLERAGRQTEQGPNYGLRVSEDSFEVHFGLPKAVPGARTSLRRSLRPE